MNDVIHNSNTMHRVGGVTNYCAISTSQPVFMGHMYSSTEIPQVVPLFSTILLYKNNCRPQLIVRSFAWLLELLRVEFYYKYIDVTMSSSTSKIVIAVLLSSLIICVDCKANDTTTFSVRIEGGKEMRQSVYYENSTHQDNIAGINDGLSAKFVKDCPRRGSRMRHSCGMVTKKKMGEEYFLHFSGKKCHHRK